MIGEIKRDKILTLEATLGTYKIPLYRKVEGGDGVHMDDLYLINAPHLNCQTYSIANFMALVHYENIKELIEYASEYSGKRQLLLDVNKSIVPAVKKVFDGFIVFEQEYISTNDSEMCIMLIKSLECFNGPEEDDDCEDDYDDDEEGPGDDY